MQPNTAFDEVSVPLAEDSAPAFVEIRFKQLPERCSIINTKRRELKGIVLEPGIRLFVSKAPSAEKGAKNDSHMVMSPQGDLGYVSGNDIAIDSSALPTEDQSRLSIYKQRIVLMNMLRGMATSEAPRREDLEFDAETGSASL
jgi:hypothetical protein